MTLYERQSSESDDNQTELLLPLPLPLCLSQDIHSFLCRPLPLSSLLRKSLILFSVDNQGTQCKPEHKENQGTKLYLFTDWPDSTNYVGRYSLLDIVTNQIFML